MSDWINPMNNHICDGLRSKFLSTFETIIIPNGERRNHYKQLIINAADVNAGEASIGIA